MAAETLRVDLCPADDEDTAERVLAVFRSLGIVADDTWYDGPLGIGLTRFRRGPEELSLYRDTYGVDLYGPAGTVREILAALAAADS
jgi:hypothetical protein